MIAPDMRSDKQTREAADEPLEATTPDAIVVVGFVAYHTAECFGFVRLLDRPIVAAAPPGPHQSPARGHMGLYAGEGGEGKERQMTEEGHRFAWRGWQGPAKPDTFI